MNESDSLASLQALLAVLIHRWQLAALEEQAFRRVTQGDQRIQAEVAATLASTPFADRLKSTDALRNQVLQHLANGRPLEIAASLGDLAALLGQTPEGLEDSL